MVAIPGLLIHTLSAVAAELQGARFRLGTPTEAGDIDGGAVAVTIAPRRTPAWLRWIGDDMHIEVAGSFWSDAGPDGDVYTTHVGPAWRYRPGLLGDRGFIEAGTSIAWVSEERVAGSDLGSKWHFTTHATLGFLLDPRKRWHAGLRVRHSSNAGFESPNPGLDIVMLEVGYRFGGREP
jgi:hypothetical protein